MLAKCLSLNNLLLRDPSIRVFNEVILNDKEPQQHQHDQGNPEHFLFKLRTSLFNSEKLLVRVAFFFLLIKFLVLIHPFYVFLWPNAFEVIDLQLWFRWYKPPKEIDSQMLFCVVIKVLLLAILSFQIVNVTLIVINTPQLFLNQFKCKVREQ